MVAWDVKQTITGGSSSWILEFIRARKEVKQTARLEIYLAGSRTPPPSNGGVSKNPHRHLQKKELLNISRVRGVGHRASLSQC